MSCGIKTDLAILVSKKYLKEKHLDDLALEKAMNRRGYSVDIVVWDNHDYDYSSCNAAIIRSCWDYDLRVDEFLQRMFIIEKQCQLFNSYELIKENSNKIYLAGLKEKGLPVVPSVFIQSLSELELPSASLNSKQLVIKPTVSASGRDTFRVKTEDMLAVRKAVRSIVKKQKQVVIQPYLEAIETLGERSTVVINGEPVFTMLKKPAPGNFLVHNHWGGSYFKSETTKQDYFFIKKVIKAFDALPLYARVDYIYHNGCNPLLLEIELIEPNLYLAENHPGLEKLANSLASIIERRRQLEA